MGPLAKVIQESLLFELNIDPKPGLVTPTSNGIHKDMDYKMMLISTHMIAEKWDEIYKTITGEETFEQLREIGLNLEKLMFKISKGVNTHKGFIFLSLIVISAWKNKKNRFELFEKASLLGKEVLKDFETNKYDTFGLQAYKEYGIKGIRGEVCDWEITNLAIEHLKEGKGPEYTLIFIISRLNDTCVIKRGGMESLTNIKKEARIILNNFTPLNYEKFCKFVTKEGISCGGAADILSIAKLIITLFENKKILK